MPCQHGAGVDRELGGDTVRTADKTTKGISLYYMLSYSAVKSGVKKEEVGDIQKMVLVFPRNY